MTQSTGHCQGAATAARRPVRQWGPSSRESGRWLSVTVAAGLTIAVFALAVLDMGTMRLFRRQERARQERSVVIPLMAPRPVRPIVARRPLLRAFPNIGALAPSSIATTSPDTQNVGDAQGAKRESKPVFSPSLADSAKPPWTDLPPSFTPTLPALVARAFAPESGGMLKWLSLAEMLAALAHDTAYQAKVRLQKRNESAEPPGGGRHVAIAHTLVSFDIFALLNKRTRARRARDSVVNAGNLAILHRLQDRARVRDSLRAGSLRAAPPLKPPQLMWADAARAVP